MLLQPALPVYFVDVLGISYTELALAFSVCKGLGYAIASPFWARLLEKVRLQFLLRWVCSAFAFYCLLLLGAQFSLTWLFAAYACYGVAQAGSHLCWHMSGPIFAGDEDSSTYSGVNVVSVGLRGIVMPPLGEQLLRFGNWGAFGPLYASLVLCCLGAWVALPRRMQNPEPGASYQR